MRRNTPRIAKTIALAKIARIAREEAADYDTDDYKIYNSKVPRITKKQQPSTKPSIIESISVCYCGYEECDWGCGVQSCGGCIDVCRCDRYFR
jgi:hypothetical protein